MLKHLTAAFHLCVFRGHVATIDSSINTIAFFGSLVVLFTVIHAQLSSSGSATQFYLITAAYLLLMLLMIYLLLKFRGRAERWTKTFVAYMGTRAITDGVVALALVVSSQSNIGDTLITLAAFWRIGVVGHILKQALEIKLLAALLLAFSFTVVATFLAVLIFGYPQAVDGGTPL